MFSRNCGNHSSRTYITIRLKQPTQKQRGPRLSFSIWSCSRWGLPCHKLLPVARCALTAPFHPYLNKPKQIEAVSFCCTSRGHYTPQALPGTLPFGARTFLPANNPKDCSHSDYPANFAQNYSIQTDHNIYFFLRMNRPRAILIRLFLDKKGTSRRPLTPSLLFNAFNPS